MALRLGTILLVCCAGCVLAQYGGGDDGGPTPPKKPLLIPGARRIKQPAGPAARLANPTSQTTIINQRFRRPIPINRPRPSAEPIPELPVFTSGIRGSRPSAALALEQNDEPSLPIQSIQQPHIVHAQSLGLAPALPHHKAEVKPVSEENEKDEDVVQVIANLGQVSNYGVQGNLLTPTPVPVSAAGYLHQLQQQQDRQSERQHQQDRQQQQHQQQHQDRQFEKQSQHDRQHERQQERQQERNQQQEQRNQQQEQRNQQQEHRNQQQVAPVQYRPAHHVSRSSASVLPDQVIAPVQYRPQKPVRLQKQQQQQHLVERNEYDLDEARPVVKQRAQVAPKKSKPHQADYYEGRSKKPVAQVIRRYRDETADGSIIWGFENDDGSFKEEIIGIDCITRGKYGYVDPDGLRREYTYETGIKCDDETQQQQDQDILNTFVDYQENKLVLPSGKTIDLSSMGKKQARRPQPLYRN